MSICGELHLFTTTQQRPTAEAACRALESLGCTEVLEVCHSDAQDVSWTGMQNARDPDAPFDNSLVWPAHAEETLRGNCSPREAVAMLTEDGLFTMDLEAPDLVRRAEAALAAIPISTRAEFVPCSPSILIGKHDIFDAVAEPPILFGHAAFSLSFFGYGPPNDWEEYRRLVAESRFVTEVCAQLHPILGPMDVAATWSV